PTMISTYLHFDHTYYFLFLMLRLLPRSTLFPYTTLFRSWGIYQLAFLKGNAAEMERQLAWAAGKPGSEDILLSFQSDTEAYYGRDRKSTRLNSSHVAISYAVFCLKKKKKHLLSN